MTVDDAPASQTPVWGRRLVATPGLLALWIVGVVPVVLLGALTVGLGYFLSEVGVAIEDRSRLDEAGVGVAAVRGLLYFVAVMGGAPFLLRSVTKRVVLRWELGAVLLGLAGTAPLLNQVWRSPGRSAGLMLGACMAATALLAIVGFQIAAALTGWAWKAASKHSFVALIVGPGGVVLGVLLGLSYAFLILAASELEDFSDDQFVGQKSGLAAVGEFVFFVAEEARENHRARSMVPALNLGRLSGLPWVSSAYAASPEGPFGNCMLVLHERAPGRPDGKVDQAGRRLRRLLKVSFDEARDLAADKALYVCTKVADEYPPPTADDIRGYYWRAITYAGIDVFREREKHGRTCSLSERRKRNLVDRGWDDLLGYSEALQCVNAARCRLPQDQQKWLNLCAEFSTREIEERTDVSSSTAGRECKKARDKFRQLFSAVCG